MQVRKCSTATLSAAFGLAVLGISIQAAGQTLPSDERLQQAVTWMNTVVLTQPVGDLGAYTPDQKAALIADLQKWMRSSATVSSVDTPVTGDPAAKPKREVKEAMVFPAKGSLWLLVPQIKADVSEASKWVYGVPYGSPKGASNAFYPNPDSYLFTGTVTFNFAQAFLSISDRKNLCDSLSYTNETTAEQEKTPRCSGINKIPFLMSARRRDSWQRLLSAVTLISTTSQNPRFSQGLVPQEGTVSYEKTFSETVTGTFDATKLFLTATDYKNGLDINGVVSKTLTDPEDLAGTRLPQPCIDKKAADDKDATQSCIEAISYGYGARRQLAEMLIPTINVKAVTASDLAKSGANTYIQPPSQIPALYEFSATWDLRKYIPSATTRSDAAAVVQAVANSQKAAGDSHADPTASTSTAKADPDVRWKGQVAWFCIQLISHPDVVSNDAWWTRFQDAILGGGMGTANSSVAQVKLDTTSP